MKSAYDQMGKLSKTDKEKGIYSNVTIYYKEVEYIIYAKKNLANLAIDEKRELESKVFSMIRDRESILKGEV